MNLRVRLVVNLVEVKEQLLNTIHKYLGVSNILSNVRLNIQLLALQLFMQVFHILLVYQYRFREYLDVLGKQSADGLLVVNWLKNQQNAFFIFELNL